MKHHSRQICLPDLLCGFPCKQTAIRVYDISFYRTLMLISTRLYQLAKLYDVFADHLSCLSWVDGTITITEDNSVMYMLYHSFSIAVGAEPVILIPEWKELVRH